MTCEKVFLANETASVEDELRQWLAQNKENELLNVTVTYRLKSVPSESEQQLQRFLQELEALK